MKEIKSTLLSLFNPETANELCGVVLKDGTVLVSENFHDSPEQGFIINPALLVEHEETLWASWHTHPNGDSNLSHEDYRGFLQWPQLTHFIIGVDGVRCFVVQDGLIIEEPIG